MPRFIVEVDESSVQSIGVQTALANAFGLPYGRINVTETKLWHDGWEVPQSSDSKYLLCCKTYNQLNEIVGHHFVIIYWSNENGCFHTDDQDNTVKPETFEKFVAAWTYAPDVPSNHRI